MPLCDDPTCWPGRPHDHLSLPNPCPHITRLDVIAARLSGDPALLAEVTNCADCNNDKENNPCSNN